MTAKGLLFHVIYKRVLAKLLKYHVLISNVISILTCPTSFVMIYGMKIKLKLKLNAAVVAQPRPRSQRFPFVCAFKETSGRPEVP